MRSVLGCSLVLLLAALPAACTIAPVDFTDKDCPCGEGFACVAERCVVSAEPSCEAMLQPTDFRVLFTTPRSIVWAWTPSGEPTGLLRYEIEVVDSENPDEVIAVVGPEEDPALGFYFLPRTQGAEDLVTAATIEELSPMTTYSARLAVMDTSLCTFRSPFSAGTTISESPESITIFDDDSRPVGLTPGSFAGTDSPGGGRHLSWQGARDAECIGLGNDICTQNLQILPMSSDLRVITPGPFANTAYLELELSYDGDTPSYYSSLRIIVTQDGSTMRTFYVAPFTIASTSWRTIQVPLRVFADEGEHLTPELIEAAGGYVYSIAVGGQWDTTTESGGPSTVEIDNVRIRY